MTKTKTMFVCQNCGAQSPAWLGRCPACESWNTLLEESILGESMATGTISTKANILPKEEPVLLADILGEEKDRYQIGIEELDRVLGGGIVPGSVVLIGGDPGIGKSTLSLQMACLLSETGHQVLYVSGEESTRQTKMRADRLSTKSKSHLYLVNQTNLLAVIEHIEKLNPDVVILDSIQVVYHPEITSSPGSVSQVRECAGILTQLAKAKNVALFIIGHVTKEGTLAGT